MKYFILCLMLVISTSCKQDYKSQKVKSSYENVMKVHDEVMPKMSPISKIKRKIKKSSDTTALRMSMMKQMDDANDGMMEWMSGFKLDNSLSETEQLEYLAKEQVKIQKVSDDMLKAIEDGNAYLNKLAQN